MQLFFSLLSFLPYFLLLTSSTTANPIAAAPNGRQSINSQMIRPNSPFPLNAFSNSSEMGINCNGSPFGCIGASSANMMHVLRDYMSVLHSWPQIRYIAGQKIACKEHSVFPFIVRGYFCAFVEGENVPAKGVGGDLLLPKMQQLIDHGCMGCGSVPLENGNNPNKLGKLTVNYVKSSECVGLCFYGKSGFIQQIRFVGDTAPPPANAPANPARLKEGGISTSAVASPSSIAADPPPPISTGNDNAPDVARDLQEATTTNVPPPSIVSVRYIPGVTFRPEDLPGIRPATDGRGGVVIDDGNTVRTEFDTFERDGGRAVDR